MVFEKDLIKLKDTKYTKECQMKRKLPVRNFSVYIVMLLSIPGILENGIPFVL